jgi:ketosteroid isomerase-like protein
MDEQQVETFRRIYTAVQRGDSEQLQQNLAHDIEWVLPDSVPWGGTHHGHLGVAAMRDVYEDHVDGSWADPDEIIWAEDDTVIVLGRIRGRVRASDESFEVSFAHVWRLSDGVPSSFRALFDTAPITEALRGTGAADRLP